MRPDPASRRMIDTERWAGIVGRPKCDVLRLEGFLPQRASAPQAQSRNRSGSAALIERSTGSGQLPIVLCPGGQLLRIPRRPSLPAASGWWGRSIRIASNDVASVAGPAGLATGSMRHPRAFPCWLDCRVRRPAAPRPGSRTTRFRPASPACPDGAALQPGTEFGSRWRSRMR